MDKVKISFQATVPVEVCGEIEIPAELQDTIEPEHAWSKEIEKYIQDNFDGDHVQVDSIDSSDMDFDDVKFLPRTK